MKQKILRVTTVASTMNVILKGQLSFLSRYFKVIGATSKFHTYFEEISEREGIKMYEVDLTRKITPFRDLLALFTLVRIIIKEKPKIIHTQTPKANLIGMLAAYLCRTPVRMLSIVGMPTYKEHGLKGKLLKLLDKLAFRLSTNVYPNSKGLLEYYKRWSLLKNKIGFIGNGSSNGIDFEYYNPSAVEEEKIHNVRIETGFKEEHFVFTFMGRVVNDKGINELLDAFLSFCEEDVYKNVRLLIVGPLRDSDDPVSVHYQEILNNHPKICHVGLQKEVRPFLMISNVFVFPSHREGLPGSLIQAGAMGLPLIASQIIGNTEIVEQGGGILFPVKNKNALSIAMKHIHDDQEKRENLCRNTRQRLKQLYDQEFYWSCLKQEYQNLLQS